jgi:hypothetical protein
LTYFDRARAHDRIVGGRDGNVLKGSAAIIRKPEEEPDNCADIGNQGEIKMADSADPGLAEDHSLDNSETLKIETVSEIKKSHDKIIRWAYFPKNSKEREHI